MDGKAGFFEAQGLTNCPFGHEAGSRSGAERREAPALPFPGAGECGCLVTPALSLTGETNRQKSGLEARLFDAEVFLAESIRAAHVGDFDEADRLRLEGVRREWDAYQ